jgi:hypothetical protein
MWNMLRCAFLAFLPSPNIESEWNLHYGAHSHWKKEVYSKFNVTDINQVLNVEPAIDHEDHYHATLPDYFIQNPTVHWIDENYQKLSQDQLKEARIMLDESAAIYAAFAMCHPRDRVGKFDWSDVFRLHQTLITSHFKLLQKHNVSDFFSLYKNR